MPRRRARSPTAQVIGPGTTTACSYSLRWAAPALIAGVINEK
ncbi:hypothetical protein OVX87_29330 [Klebsiella pneumoniae]|nr:hypothetical protein [Klebsiella pneumoniae]